MSQIVFVVLSLYTYAFSRFCRYLDSIEMAVANGDCLFLENIDESIDPVLDNLLGRLTIKKGRYIKIGDKEVEFHPKLVRALSFSPIAICPLFY